MTNFVRSTHLPVIADIQTIVHEWDLHLLLANVKKSIELWFLTGFRTGGTASVSYDQVLNTCMDVLKHGFQLLSEQTQLNAVHDTKVLIKLQDDFEWLRRSTQLRTATAAACSKRVYAPAMLNVQQFLKSWILRNLKTNSLCAALQALIAEKDLLQQYYPSSAAFMRNEAYATAFFICLSALELNQHSLLSQINAKLYGPPMHILNERVRHRRTSSHPNFSVSPPKQSGFAHKQVVSETNKGQQNITKLTAALPTFRKVKSLPQLQLISALEEEQDTDLPRKRSKTCGSLTRAVSVKSAAPILLSNTFRKHSVSNTTLNSDSLFLTPCGIKEATSSASSMISAQSDVTNSTNSSTTTARCIQLINCDNIKIWTDQTWELEQKQKQNQTAAIASAPCAIPQIAMPAKSISPMHSFLSNIFGTPPSYTSWSVQEQQQQQQQVFSDVEDLKQDNSIDVQTSADTAEILCANNNENSISSNNYTDCTSKIANMFDAFLPTYGKKLRPQCSQSLFENGISYLDYSQQTTSNAQNKVSSENFESSVNEQILRTPKNFQRLTAYLQMSKMSRTNTELEKENAHFLISEAIISAVEHIKWAKMQTSDKTAANIDKVEEHIPYAEVSGVEEFADQHSAEFVGLTLLSKFNDTSMPKVCELKWLVSEEDAPQALLPLPESIAKDPDDNFVPSLTRGTLYWAPPRPQIIFTDHPPPNRKKLLQQQNNRCAGCGMVVSAQHVQSFRFCTYLGKYHCTGCHRNQMSATPAKILQFWDFKYYPVSVFAYRLLEQMYACPLFHAPDLNPTLYERQRSLRTARMKRLQLKYVRDFVKSCRFAKREQQHFNVVPEYLTAEPDLWSMNDFFDAHHKSMHRSIDDLIERCENHIFHCVLCTARGFLCEHCHKDQIIYPWQNHVHRCDYCGACFHRKCWTTGMLGTCLRCQRISQRQVEETVEAN